MLRRILGASLLVVLVFVATPAMAQITESGTISGTVTDPDGTPLPGVQVTLDTVEIPSQSSFSRVNGTYRFVALPAGEYTLTFSLSGFASIVNENVVVRVGTTTTLDVAMQLSDVEETVTITATTPLVDVKKTGLANNVTEQYMQSIPSARDPWVMMEHTAGIQVDRQNIGGSESGQQSGFNAAGSDGDDTMWTYDGAELTDMAAVGASPMYYDFDAFEEVSITTGGNDPSIATGGMRINFVTKRGGNDWRGSTRFYFTDQGLQNDPIIDRDTGDYTENFDPDELYPGYVGNAINNIKDYGFEIGGPAVTDKLFVWGAFGKQNIKQLVGTSQDNTQLTHWHIKATAHIGLDDVVNFTFLHADKTKQGRGASASRHPDATWDQEGPSPAYTVKWQRTFTDNFYLESVFNYTALGFALEPQGGREPQPGYDYATGYAWASSWYYATTRPLYSFRIDGNSYLAESIGADHEFKFGYSYRWAEVDSESGYAGGALRAYDDGEPLEAWVVGPARDIYRGVRHSLYFGDTISADRFTVNAGLRFDAQTSISLPSASPASPLDPEGFPAREFGGFDPGWGWNSLSPRLGFTYDLSGDGTTILRANAARYYSQMPAWELHLLNTTNWAEVDYEWFDLNGNDTIDAGETGDILWISSGFDPENPNAESPNQVSKTTPPKTDEVILGVDHEISGNLAIGGSFIWKKFHNTTWNPRGGISSADYFPVNYNIDPVGDITIYELNQTLPGYSHYRQRPDWNTSYKGVELLLTKRYSDGWMANASLNFAGFKQNYESPDSYLDPTNVGYENGEDRLLVSSGSGRSGTYYGAARWYFKSSGMYELPYDVTLGGFFQIREGYLNPLFVESPSRPNLLGRIDAWTQPVSTNKLPTYWDVDLRVEKTFDLGADVRMHLIGDIFNLFNNQTVLARHNQMNSTNYNLIREVMQGRVLRLGLRFTLR